MCIKCLNLNTASVHHKVLRASNNRRNQIDALKLHSLLNRHNEVFRNAAQAFLFVRCVGVLYLSSSISTCVKGLRCAGAGHESSSVAPARLQISINSARLFTANISFQHWQMTTLLFNILFITFSCFVFKCQQWITNYTNGSEICPRQIQKNLKY